MNWVSQLADLSRGKQIDWSDSWSEEDMADATLAAFRRFEEMEQGEQ